MRNKILRSTACLILTAMLLFGVLLMGALYAFFTEQLNDTLDAECGVIASVLEGADTDALSKMAAANPDSRLTLVAPDGSVLYDSYSDSAGMENHLARPEIQQALETGRGSSTRTSDTLGQRTIYRALRLTDGSVLRISQTQNTIWGLLGRFAPMLVGILIVAFLAVALTARRTTRGIVRPINALDLEHPADNDVYPELSPLLVRMSEQKRSIERYILELTRRQTEFSAITLNMSEALLLLNACGEIVFMNRSAEDLFHADFANSAGKYLLALDRNLTLSEALEGAREGRRFSGQIEIGSRDYQLLASPVQEEQKVTGVVLLLPDITDRVRAEQARREFTANVSHELKTPLTVILGYAEIMKNGVAEADKLRQFAGQIHLEAESMLTLVNDILNLSRLDENRVDEALERFDLYKLCESVAQRLSGKAEKAGIQFTVEGEEAPVRAYRRLCGEMLYNLMDNAIQYNYPNGWVRVRVTVQDGAPTVCVSDNGMGIPEEYHQRVFERFFRVDKSHSGSIPGTGLGLSIVKHAAQINRATVQLQSAPGRGTEVTLVFPECPKSL